MPVSYKKNKGYATAFHVTFAENFQQALLNTSYE